MMLAVYALGALLRFALAMPAADASKTTLTYTATTTRTVTTTVTGPAQTVSYLTVTSGATESKIDYVYTSTASSTFIQSYTAFSSPKAAHTVTRPVQPGFFPLLSASEYTDAISIVKSTVTQTLTHVYDPSPSSTFTKTQTTHPVVTYSTASVATTVPVGSKSTSTRTLASSATHTAYAACQTNNLVSKIPTGQTLNPGLYTYVTNTPHDNVYDAADCCGICMQTNGCAGGYFMAEQYGDHKCVTFLLDPNNSTETCNSRGMYSQFLSDPRQYDYDTPATIFNGPCGGWQWQFTSDAYF